MVRFDRKVKCGADYVALRTIDNGREMDYGGILISQSAFSNDKLGFYQVIDIGECAEKEYDVHVGDYVLADRLAIYYRSEPVGIMKCNSVIVKTNKDRSEYYPLLNMCFVEPRDRGQTELDDGIIVQSSKEVLRIGTITAKNMSPDVIFPFEVGDTVLMPESDDFVSFGEKKFHIYKHDKVLCKVLEE